jgi:hypothetical protein
MSGDRTDNCDTNNAEVKSMPTYGYFLQHIRENRTTSACSLTQCQADYYRMMRDPDGSIPWRMFYRTRGHAFGPQRLYEIDPKTGFTLNETEKGA